MYVFGDLMSTTDKANLWYIIGCKLHHKSRFYKDKLDLNSFLNSMRVSLVCFHDLVPLVFDTRQICSRT